MTKCFKRLSEEVPIADIMRALALMRFRTTHPTQDSLAFASIELCSSELGISYQKTRKLLKEVVEANMPPPPQN